MKDNNMGDERIKPTPVVIVRPRHEKWYGIGKGAGEFLVGIAASFLFALVAWWIGPLVFGDAYTLGYWQTFGLIFFLRMIVPRAASPRYQDDLRQAQP